MKVCKEFNWDVDDWEKEKARCEATAEGDAGRKACATRVALKNMWRCMMEGRELQASGVCRQNKDTKVSQSRPTVSLLTPSLAMLGNLMLTFGQFLTIAKTTSLPGMYSRSFTVDCVDNVPLRWALSVFWWESHRRGVHLHPRLHNLLCQQKDRTQHGVA